MTEQPPGGQQVLHEPDVSGPAPSGSSLLTSAAMSQVKTGRGGDVAFAALTKGASIVVIAMVAFVAVFLLWRAVPSLRQNQASFLFSRIWEPASLPPSFGIAGIFYTTVLIATWALILAVPVSIGLALFITQVVRRSRGRPCDRNRHAWLRPWPAADCCSRASRWARSR